MLQIFFYAGPVLAFSLYLFVELYFISLRYKTDIRKNIRAWTVELTAAGEFAQKKKKKKAADTRKSNRESKMKAMGVVTPEVSIKKKPNLKK